MPTSADPAPPDDAARFRVNLVRVMTVQVVALILLWLAPAPLHELTRTMHWLNWAIVVGWLAYVAIDGLRRARGTKNIEGYFLASRSLPWWAVGLSVMATQLSAVTMIGTTGQGAVDGMRFVQFYFGLPIAMVILGVTLVPFLHGAKVYTAYEYLERRFDAKTRSLTAFLFLLSRGMSCGTILAAPAVVFSAIFGWPLGVVRRDHGRADGALHGDRRRAGGHVGRREADGRSSSSRSSAIVTVLLLAHSRVARRRAAHRRRGGPAAARSTSRSASRTPTRSGRASSAARS